LAYIRQPLEPASVNRSMAPWTVIPVLAYEDVGQAAV
jgi:hypothetical protein